MSEPDLDRIAEVLRLCEFAMDRAEVALIAFTPNVHTVARDAERLREVRRMVAEVLGSLPPEPPMSEERRRECEALIRQALRRFA